MRSALTIGILFLGLVLLLNLDAALPVDPALTPNEEAPGAEGTPVRIFSAGLYLSPATFERRGFSEAIILDGDLFTSGFLVEGLRVAFFREGRVAYDTYDLANSKEELQRLRERLAAAPEDTCVAMGVFRTIKPVKGEGAEERAAAVGQLLASIGAREMPHKIRFSSWAYLAVHRNGSWRPLAESFSRTRGVGLSFQVADDLTNYDRFQPDVFVDTSVVHALTTPYRVGEVRLDPFTIVRRGHTASFEINGIARDGIQAAPPFGAKAEGFPSEGRVRWPFVRLGARPVFRTLLGIAKWHVPHCKGLEFQVWVNGELAGSHRLGGVPKGTVDAADSWVPWQVDLEPWGEKWVALELRTRQTSIPEGERSPYLDPAIWGAPEIVYDGVETSKEPLAKDVFLDLFDRNRDGVLMRDEVGLRVKVFDRNKDGLIQLAEVPAEARDFLTEMDGDGDGAVSTADFEGWYDRNTAAE